MVQECWGEPVGHESREVRREDTVTGREGEREETARGRGREGGRERGK
jgi:hypothetical protein